MNTSAVNHGISSVCSIFTNWTIIGILWHTNKWSVYIPRNKMPFLYYLTILIFRSLRSLCIFMSSDKNIHRIESKPKFIFFLAFLLNSCWLFLKKTQTKRMILTTLKEKNIYIYYRLRSMDLLDPAIPLFCVLHSLLIKLIEEVAILGVA